jgi:hypothetical protein
VTVAVNATGQREVVLSPAQSREYVSGGADTGETVSEIRGLRRDISELIAAVDALPDATGGALGDVLNGMARQPVRRSSYGAVLPVV